MTFYAVVYADVTFNNEFHETHLDCGIDSIWDNWEDAKNRLRDLEVACEHHHVAIDAW